ncbi:glycosyltransferase [Baekduia soli]|uniref:Glycosyltransferase n=1 Tax=Baekduia soli TaxID=496014 RepID=A0A5B8TZU1_9ACTN|nr:glycosyltransferase [Baekduia soli]QEC46244.1 glycosyltransferase [Baekduia soli]
MAVLALCLGDPEGAPLDGAEVVALEDLPVAQAWERVAASSLEHRDSVLAGPLLALALERDEQAIFLGTSMRVCAPLDPLTGALGDHDVALAGMAEARLPDDDRSPSAAIIERAGLVNPRVVALRRGTVADVLLAAWPDVVDVESPLADATVLEAPPELCPTIVVRHLERAAADASGLVVRDPGVAAAYWNLPLRPVTTVDGELRVGGAPLCLLDLAGSDGGDPAGLWSGQDRVRLIDTPALAQLVIGFADELRATPPDAPAAFAHDARGRHLDRVLRRLVREGVAEGALSAPPWADDGIDAWEELLGQPAPAGASAGITRYHHAIWESREDVQRTFPDLDGPDGPEFARWVREWGPEAPEAPGHAGTPERKLPWGVNVAGFFRSELGLGEAARLLIRSLDSVHVPALPVHGAFVPPTRQHAEFTFTTPDESPYPINIICLNGDVVPGFARESQQHFFADRHTIALWWWEVVDAFPQDWYPAFEHLDEIWVATDHIYQAIAPHSPVPVNKVRMPVVMPRIGHFPRSRLGMPEEGFTFLYVFDYHSTTARKNPVGHVEAFKAAFGEGSGAKLVLKCINADRMIAQHTRTLLAIDGHPDITVIDDFVSADEKNAMLAACDCYVSLHRSEGFGLTPAEAMALGKPVIATRYGGVLDFMTDENSYLVDHGWTAVGPGAHPYPADAVWAEPDLDHAAHLMREVFENQDEARQRGVRAQRDIQERHAPHVAGEIMLARLQNIHNGLSRSANAVTALPGAWDPEKTARRIRTPMPPVVGRGRIVKGAYRSAVGRAILPYLNRERGIDEHLLEGLVRIQDQLADVPARAAEITAAGLRQERAMTLAAFRRMRAQVDDHRRWLETLDHDVRTTADRVTHLSAFEHHVAEHRALPFMTEPFECWDDPQAGRVEGFRTALPAAEGDTYHDFEQRFRGTRERISDLQRPYVDLLRGHDPVLDCGCGRGELLELLGEAGISASGVDLDEGMLAEARSCGLDVTTGDAIALLTEAEPGAYGAVTAMQVIEHLPEPALVAFLRAGRRALGAGGRLIVETVNPHSVVALKAFWLDPTHQHPLFPEVVLELCREAGFDRGFVMHPGGEGDVERDRYRIAAYAIVADVGPET